MSYLYLSGKLDIAGTKWMSNKARKVELNGVLEAIKRKGDG